MSLVGLLFRILFRRPKLTLLAIFFMAILMFIFYNYILLKVLLNSHEEDDFERMAMLIAGASGNSGGVGDGRSSDIVDCRTLSIEAQKLLRHFLGDTLRTLAMLDVTHFMCYSSLWRALKRSNRNRPDPEIYVDNANNNNSAATPFEFHMYTQEACFNLCVLKEDFDKHDFSLIEARLQQARISIKYLYADGTYVLRPNVLVSPLDDAEPKVDDTSAVHIRLHLFVRDALDHEQYRRDDWKGRLMPTSDCEQLDCFPASLVESRPLPKVYYMPALAVPVPWEGIEIQKYHYPNSWWKLYDEDNC